MLIDTQIDRNITTGSFYNFLASADLLEYMSLCPQSIGENFENIHVHFLVR
jgi:hypothetical protein